MIMRKSINLWGLDLGANKPMPAAERYFNIAVEQQKKTSLFVFIKMAMRLAISWQFYTNND